MERPTSSPTKIQLDFIWQKLMELGMSKTAAHALVDEAISAGHTPFGELRCHPANRWTDLCVVLRGVE